MIIENILATNNRIFVGGKGLAKCLSYEGETLSVYGKASKIGLAGSYLLIC